MDGTHVSIEPSHSFRYLDEQALRYNNCKYMAGRLRRNVTVLVDIPELMKSPELPGLLGIPCVVWLKCINHAHSGSRDAFHRTLEQASPVGITHANYGVTSSVV